jgi:drug/metabolite transporter (DMT)-like permease
VWATAIALLPLATVFALAFTAPAHTALLSAVFLREQLTHSRLGVVIFGFLGVPAARAASSSAAIVARSSASRQPCSSAEALQCVLQA